MGGRDGKRGVFADRGILMRGQGRRKGDGGGGDGRGRRKKDGGGRKMGK